LAYYCIAVTKRPIAGAAVVTLRRKKLDQLFAMMSIDKDLVTDILTRLGLEMIEVRMEAWLTKAVPSVIVFEYCFEADCDARSGRRIL